ncbi:MAG TPA: autotransporter outer membrane beta-barrel domain-containing protein [Phenylobacterium sp.]|uniref:autotransporter outer membrane beta-barrel domain-containing protein n=1 Tax=Phenylobacterium sp. TaxID=1871053 RepID=UPI002C09C63F|nr:autotransporter outer membrane beta-barrel domain-containing protein [Phenylobacterium sp.]HXA38110.1 autotransporter outer membrane beta-barrel domain-containing protein [Phenylobacterium sp.]
MTGYFSPDAARDLAQGPSDGSRRSGALARILLAGPAMVSASALLWAVPALAQTTPSTTISSNTATPVKTSTAGDVTINSGASIKPPSGVAVTIDSSNSLTNNGVIMFQNLDNVTGVLANGGNAGFITNNGTIEVDDTSTTTTDSNGIVHGPFANGTNRFGIRVVGPGAFTGDISNGSIGNITIKGDNSAAMSIEANLVGALSNLGTISVAGTNSFGIRTTGSVSGAVTLSGTLTAAGQGVQGANFGGDIGGQLLINGAISSTGYRYTTRSTDPTFLGHLAADDLLQGGSAVTVGGSVAQGILVDAITTTDSTTGLTSTVAGSITSFGQAPALVVGGASGRNITLGNVGTTTDAFGIEIKGSVLGSGVYDGVSATGMQLGVTGGGTVNTTGGVRIVGSVGASSYAASSTAITMNGVIAPVFRNEGAIASVMNSDAAGAASTGVAIGAGSNVSVYQNAGTLTASVAGQKADVIALVDHSGTISDVENIGTISATRTLSTAGAPVTGKNVALDLSANTTGVRLLQDAPSGDTLVPSITGSVLLGSGADQVQILAGTLTGNLDLGAGANSLTIDNGASVKGNLDAAGGTVALAVNNGTLQINDTSHLKLTSLNLGSTSTLIVTADPNAGQATNLNVAGTATLASGAKIGVRLASILPGTSTFTLIQATQLNAGTVDSSLLGTTPFLYTTNLTTNAAAGTVNATLTLKTAAQLGLPSTTAAAYNPLIANIVKDAGLEGALLAQTSRSGLINLYNQLMPNHSGSLFNTIAANVSAFARPLDDRQDPQGGGFWMQETNAGVFAKGQTDDPGYKAWSFGVVAGYEVPRTPLGILGVTFGGGTNAVYPDNVDSAEDLHANLIDAGVYWRMTKGAFSANMRVGADYAQISSVRVVEVLGGDGLAVNRVANGHWSAFGVNARAAASYEAHVGRNLYIRPQGNIEYMRLAEGSYTETGGGDGMDLSVASRTSSRLTTFAGVAVGALYGPDKSWGPEALVGYKAVVSDVLGTTTARFVAGGDAFTLRADDISGQGAVAHFSLKGENGSGGFALETGAEARSGLNIYDLRLAGHIQF